MAAQPFHSKGSIHLTERAQDTELPITIRDPSPDTKPPNPARLKAVSHPPQVYQDPHSPAGDLNSSFRKITTSPKSGLAEASVPACSRWLTQVAVVTGKLRVCPRALHSLPRGIPSPTGLLFHEHRWGRGPALEGRLRNMVLITESFLIRCGEGA